MAQLHEEWLAFEASLPPAAPITNLQEKRNNFANYIRQNNANYLAEIEPRFAQGITITNSSITARDSVDFPIRIYDSGVLAPKAIVIFYHGGGLTSWDLDTEDLFCRRVSIDAKTIVFSIGYRLAPENPFPFPVNDVWDGFLYVAENLKTFVPRYDGASSVDIIVAGTSAGGQLAAVISQLARDYQSNCPLVRKWRLKGTCLRSPVTVYGPDKEFIPPIYRDMHESWAQEFEAAGLTREGMKATHDYYTVPDSEKRNPLAYPLWGKLAGLPPTFIQLCGVDILRDDGACYLQGLIRSGVAVRAQTYVDLPHVASVKAPELKVSQQFDKDSVDGIKLLME
ncbi:alpha/beta hydrolase fold-3 domain-containing protein [Arthroderma uncinatum]|uniref:alpha/beta hydrolase fold-3 domain-containing protein n=1 Tax=Arthroderma uncinatum TaxID=74035 RepID=UPI00144AB573|nr:alpha/beta hydrolase fold-3 domain-containing protein [Arthroderma uncinatum]KAF3490743.1 alpha/beta hydrolase fold-3 domain-containing protein [Arthroderma uncinatum]